MSNLEDTDSQRTWGPNTIKRNLRKLEGKILKNEAALKEADKHVKTIAELKILFKWLKIIALTLTTIAGSVVALKTLGVL